MFKTNKIVRSLLIGLSASGLVLAACGVAVTAPPNTATPLPSTPTQFVPPATTQPDPSAMPNNSLTGSKWQLTSINGTPVPAPTTSKTVTLEFGSDGQINGSGGCNSFGGTYTTQGDSLSFGPIASTKMACVDETAMQQENQYFQILQVATKFTIAPEQLTVVGQGSDTLVFTTASIP
jgi:heat shock protein HslJ